MNNEFLKLQKLLLEQPLRKSAAIVWLQGDRYDRGPKTLELFKEGWASKIIISGNNELIGRKKRPGEDNISLSKMKQWLMKRGVRKSSIIIESGSLNTRDQSINVCRLAKKKRWKKIIIVGSYPHYQARYFLTFIRGAQRVAWSGRIINRSVLIPDNKKPGGRIKTAAELLLEELKKIEKYRKDLVSIRSGIKYLNEIK